MRCAHLAVLLLAVVGSAQRARAEAISAKGAEALLLAFVKDLQSTIGNDGGNSKRRLLTVTDVRRWRRRERLGACPPPCRPPASIPPPTLSSPFPLPPPLQIVQAFFESTLGGGWRDLVPERWANGSAFDWGKLGEFGECGGEEGGGQVEQGMRAGAGPLGHMPHAHPTQPPQHSPCPTPPQPRYRQTTAPTWATSWMRGRRPT